MSGGVDSSTVAAEGGCLERNASTTTLFEPCAPARDLDLNGARMPLLPLAAAKKSSKQAISERPIWRMCWHCNASQPSQ
jgi:hypothetical protein